MGRKIKTLIISTIVICSLLVIFFFSLTHHKHDRFIGVSESELLARFGSPDNIDKFESERALDELRAPIFNQHGNVVIKEYFYRGLLKNQHFWLKEDSNNHWIVIMDIEYPSNTKY